MFSMVLVGSGSVSFDTDPDSGSSHFFIRIRIQGNDTDYMDPDPPHWRARLSVADGKFNCKFFAEFPDPLGGC